MPPSGKRGRISVLDELLSLSVVVADAGSMTDRRGGGGGEVVAVFTEGSHDTESMPRESGLFSSTSKESSSSSSSSSSSEVMRNFDGTRLLLILRHDSRFVDNRVGR